ncbi:hypothetical protein N9301_09180 [Paracoccaceae bacterium]|nr:hypothetical protein [Paracoccaceae bacterium]
MANGLGTPIKKETETDILATTRKAFGKLSATPPTLEQRLQSLSETELGIILQTAQFVKLAHGFGTRFGTTQAYFDLTKEMYPKMGYTKQKLISDILQDAEPVEAKPVDRDIERDTTINKTLDDYAAALGKATNDIDFSTRVSSDEEKAEHLKNKILERLEVK